MTHYIFQPTKPDQSVDWSDDAVWVGGVFPDSLNADVVIPSVTLSSGQPDASFITIGAAENYNLHSLDLMSDYLTVEGSLSIAGNLTIQPGGELDMDGGTVTAANILNDGVYDIQGNGQITTTGVLTNDKLIIGSGLTLTLGGLDNTDGTLAAPSGDLTVQVLSGFVNFSDGALTGGAYSAGSGVLQLDVGHEITADGANITIGPTGEIDSYDASTSQYVSLQTTLTSITSAGHLTLDRKDFVWVPLVVDGELTLSDSATFDDSLLTVDAGGKVDGSGTIEGDIANAGTIVTKAILDDNTTSLKIAGTLTGSGQLEVGVGIIGERFAEADGGGEYYATLELSGPGSGNVSFADGTGTLQLDDPSGFTGTITPSGVAPDGFFYLSYGQPEDHGPLGDKIELAGVSLASVSNWNYVSQGDAGTLTIHAGAATYALNFVGEFSNASFTLSDSSQYFSNSTPGLDIQVMVPPAIVSLTSNPPAGGTLTTGGQVEFSLSTTNLLTATNAALTLSNGASAIFTGNDYLNPTAKDFTYTVAATDANTADLKVTGYTGSLVDSSGQALNPADVVEDTGFAVDKTAPPAPAITEPYSEPFVDNAEPTFGGTGEAGDTLTLTIDGKPVGTTTVATDGSWTITPTTPLADGPHSITAAQTNAAGIESAGSRTLNLATYAPPPAPVITAPAEGATLATVDPTISGTGEAGDTLSVSIDGNFAGQTTVAANGSWSVTPTTGLAAGSHSVTARQTNARFVQSAAAAAADFSIGPASANGDVHMTTYDGLHYDFQADGTFVLTRSTTPGDNFQVQIETAPVATNNAASFTTMLAAQFGADVLTVGIDRAVPVWLDGTPDTTLSSANAVQNFAGGTLTEVTPTQFNLTWNTGESAVVGDEEVCLDTSITLGAAQGPGSMQGLLGTDSGQSQDFRLPDGSVLPQPISNADLYSVFAPAWSVTSGNSLFDNPTTGDGTNSINAPISNSLAAPDTTPFVHASGGSSPTVLKATAPGQVLSGASGANVLSDGNDLGATFLGTLSSLGKDLIEGFSTRDVIDLTDIDSANATLNYAGSADTGVLSVSCGNMTGELYLSGSRLTAGSFHVSSDSLGGTLISIRH